VSCGAVTLSDRFHIVLVAPPGYQHALVFAEQVELLRAAFADLGVDHTVAVSRFERDRVNVVLGYHLLRWDDALPRCRYIPYQFEQLGPGGGDFVTGEAWRILRHATEVWDFSRSNVKLLRDSGVPARLLPVGYHERLELVEPRAGRDIDLLFSGSVNERRADVLRGIEAATGVAVRAMFGVYGPAKNAMLGRAKIHLHIHHGERRAFQQPRIAHLLNNRCFVIGEESEDDPYPEVDLVSVPRQQLPEACTYYLARPEERHRLAERSYRQFREHYPVTELMRRLLDR